MAESSDVGSAKSYSSVSQSSSVSSSSSSYSSSSGGKKCFAVWYAAWNCDTESWSGPSQDGWECLPEGTSTDWHEAEYCLMRKYVPLGTDCDDFGDCLGQTTDPPDLPASPPPSCCQPACRFVWRSEYSCDWQFVGLDPDDPDHYLPNGWKSPTLVGGDICPVACEPTDWYPVDNGSTPTMEKVVCIPLEEGCFEPPDFTNCFEHIPAPPERPTVQPPCWGGGGGGSSDSSSSSSSGGDSESASSSGFELPPCPPCSVTAHDCWNCPETKTVELPGAPPQVHALTWKPHLNHYEKEMDEGGGVTRRITLVCGNGEWVLSDCVSGPGGTFCTRWRFIITNSPCPPDGSYEAFFVFAGELPGPATVS